MRYIADHPTKDAKMIRRRLKLGVTTFALANIPAASAVAMHARHPH